MIDPDFDTTPCTHESCVGMLEAGSFYANLQAICWGTLGADGKANVSFYDKPRALHFIWDGVAPYIEVSVGGAGEPIYVRFHVEPTGSTINVAGFQRVCESWIARHPQVAEGNLPLSEAS